MEGREQGMNREMDKDRVLLVEDDGSLIDGLEYALKKDGFEVEVARSVEEFGKLYTDGRFDVVLLDVSLPDGNGFEICERIRRTSEVPILFLTAADEEFNVVRGLDMGGDDYVSKPFRLNELLSRIHSLQRRAGKEEKGRARYRSLCWSPAVSGWIWWETGPGWRRSRLSLQRRNTGCFVCFLRIRA